MPDIEQTGQSEWPEGLLREVFAVGEYDYVKFSEVEKDKKDFYPEELEGMPIFKGSIFKWIKKEDREKEMSYLKRLDKTRKHRLLRKFMHVARLTH